MVVQAIEGSEAYRYVLDEEVLKDRKAIEAAGLGPEDFENWGHNND